MSETFTLARPLILLGLLLLPLYGWWRWQRWQRSLVPHAPLQYNPAGRSIGWKRLLLIEGLLISVLLIALAGPHRRSEVERIDEPGIDIMLVLDVSLSMLAEDFEPNRLDVLHRTVRDFLHRSGQHRLGMVIFAKDAYVQSPLTTERALLFDLLDGANVYTMSGTKSGGTAVGDAILVAVEQLGRAKVDGRDQAMILITDGESNAGIDPVLAGRYANEQNIRFYAIGIGGEEPIEVFFEGKTIGIGSAYKAFLDDTELRKVTAAAQGRYFRATDNQILETIFLELSRLESKPLEVRTVRKRDFEVRPLAVIALILFVIWLILMGVVWRRPLR